MTYLAEGCPLVVAVERESELSRFVVENGIGISVKAGSARDFASKIRLMANDPDRAANMRANAVNIADQHFSLSTAQSNWSKLLAEITEVRNRPNV